MRSRQVIGPAAGQFQRLGSTVFRNGDQRYAYLIFGHRGGGGHDFLGAAHAVASLLLFFFRQPLMRSPRTRCGCLMIISER